MRKGISLIGGILVGVAISVGLVLIAIYPHRPRDIIDWGILISIAVPVVLGLEFIGTKILLQNAIVVRMGRLARIMFGVVVVILIAVLITLAWYWIVPHLDTW
jgi:hypothetical protein